MSAARFDTRSTMQDSFQNWSGLSHLSKSCRPRSAYTPQEWMQPISTTHREAYRQWNARRTPAFRPKQQEANNLQDVPTGRSTMQDSFLPITHFVPSKSAAPVEKKLEYMPFEGTTTMRQAYQPWPVQPRHGRAKPDGNQPWMGGGDSAPFPNSTYRDMFREIILPKSAKNAVGLQVSGGKFYPVLPKGSSAPTSKKVLMTTTSDKQTKVDIIVVLTSDDKKGKVLGEFELDGITPSRAGVAQVEVTFTLSNDSSLRVSACDVQGQRTRALSVKERVRLG